MNSIFIICASLVFASFARAKMPETPKTDSPAPSACYNQQTHLQWSKNSKETRAPASQPLVVRKCDQFTPISVEYSVSKRSFAEGNIRLFLNDTDGEPVCCSRHLILSVENKEEPGSICYHVASNNDGQGFYDLDLERIKATYNAKTGLTLKLPVEYYNSESFDGSSIKKNFDLVINRQKMTVVIK